MDYDKDWYNSLVKPKFQPPTWLFAPVWAVLYILMSIAFILIVFSEFKWFNILAYILFIWQLMINLEWSPTFFKEHNLRKAFLLCIFLNFLVFLTMLVFFTISKLAGILFVPYFLWCCFATVLCFEILELNEW